MIFYSISNSPFYGAVLTCGSSGNFFYKLSCRIHFKIRELQSFYPRLKEKDYSMKHNLMWLNSILIIILLTTVTDLNVDGHIHPTNNLPVLKYSLIGLSVIVFLSGTLYILYKSKK